VLVATSKQNTLYANLMGEVKVRIGCINYAVQGRTGFPNPIVREFCYLQLRFLCELVALSCFVAHGDIKSLQSHQTGRTYSADDILKKLTELRPHFYPFACKQTRVGEPGGYSFQLDVLEPQPLPREELLALYGKTHRYLHRGSLKKLLSSPQPIDMEIDLPEIVRWAQKINDLLSVHTIAISEDLLITCVSRNADDSNKVQVATLQKGHTPAPARTISGLSDQP
jgi:hypothetical protein